MSVPRVTFSYSDRISFREDLGGRLGDPELRDGDAELRDSSLVLAEWISRARRIMFFSGAGLSTACGIPDFRGPDGVWTVRAKDAAKRKGAKGKKGGPSAPEPAPKRQKTDQGARDAATDGMPETLPLPFVRPSFTHQFIAYFVDHEVAGSRKEIHVTSQNVDGIHFRSGVPRDRLSELHGSVFVEYCPKCKREYNRDFELETVGRSTTGRSCEQEGCRGRLRDSVLDWEQTLPDEEVNKSIDFAREADLVVCLGTSLRIVPAADIPFSMKMVAKPKKRSQGFGGEAALNGDAEPEAKADPDLEHNGEREADTDADAAKDAPDALKDDGSEGREDGVAKLETGVKAEEVAGETAGAGADATDAELPMGKVAIINLQETPKDKFADLRIFGECDRVFRIVADALSVRVPDYVRRDAWAVEVSWRAVRRKDGAFDHLVDFGLASGHGKHVPAPSIDAVEVTLTVAGGEGEEKGGRTASVRAGGAPFTGTVFLKQLPDAELPSIAFAARLVDGAADPGRNRWRLGIDGTRMRVENGVDVVLKDVKTSAAEGSAERHWAATVEAVTQIRSFY
ncbi:DHS-like NAD/FAD-binding domain-containing protein [Hyaloraphidium curvatum]|nr:DHS-like NAD/FAD-binding domain-containing protein [Hyaloraphidium curvatum]